MNSSLQRPFNPTMQRRKLAHPENATKAQNQFTYHGIAGTVLLEKIHDLPLSCSQFGSSLSKIPPETD